MIEEAAKADMKQLSPRAAIALLSLQLRSALQEATEAEAVADAIDVDAALWQLRSRLTPLIEDRRRALEAEVAIERELAAERIAAAHVEAERIIAVGVTEPVVATEPAPVVDGDEDTELDDALELDDAPEVEVVAEPALVFEGDPLLDWTFVDDITTTAPVD